MPTWGHSLPTPARRRRSNSRVTAAARPPRGPVSPVAGWSGGDAAAPPVSLTGVERLEARGLVGVVVNPGAGEGGAADLPAHVVRSELGDGDDLPELLRGLVERGCTVVGCVGGDGSTGCAAGVAVDAGRVLWAPPGGTLNHFARTLGFPDMDAAVAGLEAVRVARVDVGDVDGITFVNNASIGVYGEMVRRREALQDRRGVGKRLALVVAAARTLRHAEPIPMDVDGRPERAYLLFVGNNRYGGELAMGERDDMQAGVLDVVVLRAHGRRPRAGIVWDIALGRLARSRRLHRWSAARVSVRVRETTALAHDGEAREIGAGTVTFTSRPGALTVIVP